MGCIFSNERYSFDQENNDSPMFINTSLTALQVRRKPDPHRTFLSYAINSYIEILNSLKSILEIDCDTTMLYTYAIVSAALNSKQYVNFDPRVHNIYEMDDASYQKIVLLLCGDRVEGKFANAMTVMEYALEQIGMHIYTHRGEIPEFLSPSDFVTFVMS